MPGVELSTQWGSDTPMRYHDAGTLPEFSNWFPPPGGIRMIEFVIGPDDPAAAPPTEPDAVNAAIAQRYPGSCRLWIRTWR